MTKMNRKDYQRQTEREMRDMMNGIVRDEKGNVVSRHGNPIIKKEENTNA